jgi:signal peptidase II
MGEFEHNGSSYFSEVVLKSIFKSYILLFGLAAAVISLDQWTKYLVRSQIEFGDAWMPWDWLAPYARIVYWHNSGAAFGMGQNLSLLFTILAIVVGCVIIVYYPQIPMEDWPLRIALGMQFGGAMGNLIDRLTIGFVTDFISIGDFPVFNVADSSVSIGVVVLIVGMWIMERRQKHPLPGATDMNLNSIQILPEEEILGE